MPAVGKGVPPSSFYKAAPSLRNLSPTDDQEGSDKFLSGARTPSNRVPVISRDKIDPRLRAAAEGMEAMFLDFMMKTMRDTVPKSDMSLDSPATKIYTTMLDTEMAQKAAKAGGVGLSEQIIAYMEAQRYNPKSEVAQKELPPQEIERRTGSAKSQPKGQSESQNGIPSEIQGGLKQ